MNTFMKYDKDKELSIHERIEIANKYRQQALDQIGSLETKSKIIASHYTSFEEKENIKQRFIDIFKSDFENED